MPYHAMGSETSAVCLDFTTITTAAGRDNLLKVGGTLFVVAVLHNALGYFLGYWGARAGGLDKASCRTVAIEVGLQNGGMASGLAGAMGKLAACGDGLSRVPDATHEVLDAADRAVHGFQAAAEARGFWRVGLIEQEVELT